MKLKQVMQRLSRFKGYNEKNLKKESIKMIGSKNSSRVKNKGCFGKVKQYPKFNGGRKNEMLQQRT